MTTGPKHGWGGRRDGAGAKNKKTLSAHQVELMLKKAKEYAKKYGKTIDDILLQFIYNEGEEKGELTKKDRAACIKVWKEYTVAKIQEGGKTDEALGPGIYLPEERPDPSKVVPISKAS